MEAILFYQKLKVKNISSQDFVMNISYKFEISTCNTLCSRGRTKLAESRKTPVVAILFSKMRPKRFYGYEYILQI